VLTTRAQLNWREPRRPIVAVQDVRRVAEPVEQSNGRAGKEGKALEVIYVAIDLAAVVVMRSLNQVRRRFQCFAFPDPDPGTLAAPFDFQIIDKDAAQKRPVNLIIKRDDEERVGAFGVERFV